MCAASTPALFYRTIGVLQTCSRAAAEAACCRTAAAADWQSSCCLKAEDFKLFASSGSARQQQVSPLFFVNPCALRVHG